MSNRNEFAKRWVPGSVDFLQALRVFEDAIRGAERERCVKVCEDGTESGEHYAAAIRRGEP